MSENSNPNTPTTSAPESSDSPSQPTTPETKELKVLNIPSQTQEELNVLARDMSKGLLFSNLHVPPGEDHMLATIFLPLGMGALNQYEDESLRQIGIVYEYLNKAMPRGINGYPTFMSFRMLNRVDTEYVLTKYEKFKAAEEAVMGVTDGSN